MTQVLLDKPAGQVQVLPRDVARPGGSIQAIKLLDPERAIHQRSIPAPIRQLADSWEHIRIPSGQNVTSAKGMQGRIGLIISGAAFRQRSLVGDRRQILDVYLPGDVLGLEAAILGEESSEIVTATAATVAANAGSLRYVLSQPTAGMVLLEAAIRQRRRLENRLVRLTRLDAASRVAAFLLDMHARLGGQDDDVTFAIRLPMDQRDLADALGLSFVHVNRVLRTLRELDIVLLRRRVVTVMDRQQLRRIALQGRGIGADHVGLSPVA